MALTLCADVSKHGRRDQGSRWPLTLAPSGTPRRPTEGFWGRGSCWTWVVSSRGSVPLWQVQFLIGSEASRRPESSRHCPVWFERPGTERTGQDGSDCPQRSAAFQRHRYPRSTPHVGVTHDSVFGKTLKTHRAHIHDQISL